MSDIVELPIIWEEPIEIISRYANNIVVRHSKDEFIISFYEMRPPVMLGEPEEVKAKLHELGHVRAECVARIVVAVSKMPSFINAMKTNLAGFQAKIEALEDLDEDIEQESEEE